LAQDIQGQIQGHKRRERDRKSAVIVGRRKNVIVFVVRITTVIVLRARGQEKTRDRERH
jgi:hypothetical protein